MVRIHGWQKKLLCAGAALLLAGCGRAEREKEACKRALHDYNQKLHAQMLEQYDRSSQKYRIPEIKFDASKQGQTAFVNRKEVKIYPGSSCLYVTAEGAAGKKPDDLPASQVIFYCRKHPAHVIRAKEWQLENQSDSPRR